MAGTEAGAPEEAGIMANDGGPPTCTAPPPEWLPITSPYDLTESSDPNLNQIMCKDGAWGSSTSSTLGYGPWMISTQGTPPGGYPSPTDPGLTCQGATGYFYLRCVTMQPSVCGPSTTNCTNIQVELGGASPPPGWPCP
jgi:hypothetical protein